MRMLIHGDFYAPSGLGRQIQDLTASDDPISDHTHLPVCFLAMYLCLKLLDRRSDGPHFISYLFPCLLPLSCLLFSVCFQPLDLDPVARIITVGPLDLVLGPFYFLISILFY